MRRGAGDGTQVNAGNMLQQGLGGDKDVARAIHYLQLASADNKHAAAMLKSLQEKVLDCYPARGLTRHRPPVKGPLPRQPHSDACTCFRAARQCSALLALLLGALVLGNRVQIVALPLQPFGAALLEFLRT